MTMGFVFLLVISVAIVCVGGESDTLLSADHQGNLVLQSDNEEMPLVMNGMNVMGLLSSLSGLVAEQTSMIAEFEETISTQESTLDRLACYNKTLKSVDDSSLRVSSNSMNWKGAVTGKNGLVYFMPSNSDTILIFDPKTDGMSLRKTGVAGSSRYSSGVVLDDGKIYAIPLHATVMLMYDPETDALETYSIVGVDGTGEQWYGGGVGIDGNVYGVPYTHTHVLVVYTKTHLANASIPSMLVGAGLRKWNGAAHPPNSDVIFCVPANANAILMIDTKTSSVDYTTLTVSLSQNHKWGWGVVAPNGKVYGVPDQYEYVLVLDPITLAMDYTSFHVDRYSTSAGMFTGAVVGPHGKVYGIPYYHDHIMVFNPETNATDITSFGVTPVTAAYAGGTLAGNAIYGVPFKALAILKLEFYC
eukprot:m.11919 g.11919  ORF g.11919 m.11919 type:complete len:416 (+) comp3921_c0_seq1:70-1317(+)